MGVGGVLLAGADERGVDDAMAIFGVVIKIKLSQLSQIL